MKDLVIIAHPDDEIFWFSSILFRSNPDVICVTSGRDITDKVYRTKAFIQIMEMLCLNNYYFFEFPDTDNRLDIEKLEESLLPFAKATYGRVFTHGPYGEIFNHKHHQDISYTVHKLFDNVYSVAWNIYPDTINTLTIEEYDLKKYLLGTIYFKEYIGMIDSYRISSTEEFVRLDFKSVHIYYWAIANFGDHHELLSKTNFDFWGFADSPYEIERHAAIVKLAKHTFSKSILEFGASEGVLTDQLAEIGTVDCVEKVEKYRKILENKGHNIVQEPNTKEYDLVILASFLEYIEQPIEFIKSIKSKFIIIEVITESNLDRQIINSNFGYKKINELIVNGRWERMFHNGIKSKLPIYKLGAHCVLYKRVQ